MRDHGGGDGRPRNYKSGDFYCICDYSGFKIRRSEARKTWDGFLVRSDFWEPRQPQDLVRGTRDKISVPDARGESVDVFVSDNQVKPEDL